ncbi:MAG: 2-oxoacid:acceptor oxidoreductase subunit alpha [Paludibacteraceae bacterium]|nr:2-oxoacid:acceptor oxidoreductase subunit alpha [Paludibacteraceae bacterium]MBR1785905.1 2-oxoacid:acceptor oxidoreductase subunit alpha [Paludibacteraceae bacterium]
MKRQQTDLVVRFCGDSGDGMQLTGNLFASVSALLGNSISTFPDYPAEIRAPQGTLGGVSGFQVHIGSGNVYTPGDKADILVAMNPAALKTNTHYLKTDSVILFDTDSFTPKDFEKAQFTTDNPFTELQIAESIQLLPVPLTSLTKESLKDSGMDLKAIVRSKNMLALGVICFLTDRSIDKAIHFLENKFKKKPSVLEANLKVLTDGYNYASNLHLDIQFIIDNPSDNNSQVERASIAGNKATAFGLLAAAKKAHRQLFVGSYPITPATDIMQELALRKDLGAVVVQAEDEISGICTAIGASFAGNLAVTTTSGPGMSLKSEAVGLAVMSELPLVLVDVQRGGPSTGLPTKSEQTDLLQAIWGRNGECPVVVLAASTPANCFDFAFMAAKLALEHSTPVILLTDAYLANGTALWEVMHLKDLPPITPVGIDRQAKGHNNPALRDPESLARYMALPGTEGFEYRNMGLERDAETGTISTNPDNHARMIKTRAEKVSRVADYIPYAHVFGNPNADLLLVGFGSTEGHLKAVTEKLNKEGKPTALLQLNYIYPLQRNVKQILLRYKRVVVCELNSGQLATYLRSQIEGLHLEQINKTTAQPFEIEEIISQL